MEEALNAITNLDFISTITLAIGLIALGFILRKLNFFNEHSKKTITTIIMKISLPCLVITGFMMDFDVNLLSKSAWILFFTFISYLLCFLIGHMIFKKYSKEKRNVYSILMSFGQITLFGLPLVKSLYGNNGLITANIMSIPFRLLLYTYCFMVIANIKFQKDTFSKAIKDVFYNPIIITMVIALFIYLTQPFMYKVVIDEISYSFLRIDKTLPWLYKCINTISSLTIPLSMLLIGVTLGEVNIKGAFTNKLAWFIALFRSLISPFIIGLMIYLLVLLYKIDIDKEMIASMIICFASPVSAVVNTFCVTYNKESIIASDSCFLSTLVLIIDVPLLIVLIELIF